MKYFFLIVLSFCLHVSVSSQHHVCGTTMHDQELMDEKSRLASQDFITQRGDKIYIPIKFHLVGRNDGKGRVSYKSILNQLDVLNKEYAAHNFIFYLKDGYNFSYIDNTTLYNEPRTNEAQLEIKKDNKAVNVFVVNTIGSSILNQTVLGYFSPSNDLIVVIKNELDALSNTLSHEVGHFFNLRHTFYGWEEEPYLESKHGNPCTLTLAPGTNIQVEKMDKSNCTVAGDNVCDTPPDYHFDINYATACVFTKVVKDKNGDTIKTMINNQMSYFSNCDTFKFTAGQEARMRTNHGSGVRAYIRSAYIPNTDTLPLLCNFIWPQEKDTAYNYSSVDFSWQDMGSDYYLLEIQNGSEYYYYFTTATAITVTDLNPKKQYFASIRSFNDGYTGTSTVPVRFYTSDLQSSSKEIHTNDNLVVFPNPIVGEKLYFRLKSNQVVKSASITDGKGVSQRVEFLAEGNGLHSVSRSQLNQQKMFGFLTIQTNEANYTQKIILE